jgi:hypothetical protein
MFSYGRRTHIVNADTVRRGFRDTGTGVLMAKFRLAVRRATGRHLPQDDAREILAAWR